MVVSVNQKHSFDRLHKITAKPGGCESWERSCCALTEWRFCRCTSAQTIMHLQRRNRIYRLGSKPPCGVEAMVDELAF